MKSKAVRVCRRIAVTMIMAAMSGCTDASSPLKWKEDVRLPDGRVVTLTRYQEFKGPHELGDTPSESDSSLEFAHPDTGQLIRWQSDRDLRALALMMDGKLPTLLVFPPFGSSALRHKCPNPPYLLLRFDGDWKQVPLSQIPVKKLRVNLTFNPSGQRASIEARRHLSVEQTANSEYASRPYIIDFTMMPPQSLSYENCTRPFNYLLSTDK